MLFVPWIYPIICFAYISVSVLASRNYVFFQNAYTIVALGCFSVCGCSLKVDGLKTFAEIFKKILILLLVYCYFLHLENSYFVHVLKHFKSLIFERWISCFSDSSRWPPYLNSIVATIWFLYSIICKIIALSRRFKVRWMLFKF